MKNIFLLGMLGMVTGCVAEVPDRYPGDNRYPAHRNYWYNDNHEYNYRHFHNLPESRSRDDDRRGDRWDNDHRDDWRQRDGRWNDRD